MEQLDQQREIIQEDLRGLVGGEVRCDDVFTQLYASDGSIYEIKPLGVVRPGSTADVVACVQYATEKQIPIHARGAGTGGAGASLGRGLVLDFSKHLRRVIRTDAETIRVQPGVVCERLNSHLHKRERVFGPDPSAAAVTTIGSMIAVDAAGSRWLKYGSTRRHVRSLQVVTAEGQVMELGLESLARGMSTDSDPKKRRLIDRLAALLSENSALIHEKQPKGPLHRCGYNLADVVDEDYLDAGRLLVGSEGTLALVTEATLFTQPLVRHSGVVLLLFESLEKAARCVQEVLPLGVSACDLMDRRHISLAREMEVRFDVLIPPEAEAVLLVEIDGDEPLGVRDRVHELIDQLGNKKQLAFGARQAFDLNEKDLFWNLANKIQPSLYRVKGPSRPLPVVEDMAIPPEVLPDFLVKMQNVLKRYQVTASLFSHAGQGQLHIQPFIDLSQADDVRRMRRFAGDLYAEVFDVGGTISGEHACGLSRTSFLHRQVGQLYDVFRQVKRIFDPHNIFNPGKIIGDDPNLLTRNLRPSVKTQPRQETTDDPGGESPQLRDLVELQLDWEPWRLGEDAANCYRCGRCRAQTPDSRACPIFRFLPAEESSPRAKANLVRGILTGRIELAQLTSEEFKAVTDLCVYCQSCRVECPAAVNVPRLMRESKGAYVLTNGAGPGDWAMTRLDMLSALGSLVAPATNWALTNRPMRWLMEKTLGVAQGRKLPRISSRSFIRRASRRRLNRPTRRSGSKVLYFVDLYANYYDPQLAEAMVAVLEHNGASVYVPSRQKQAGMPSIASGVLSHARKLARRNVTVLAEAVRQGYHVVASEPSAALCLTREYPELIEDDDARLVAENSSEACTYLWNMHTTGKLQLDLKPVNAVLGYHLPCHLRALQVGSPGENLLRLIPGLRVRRIEEGCSGIAGTFGLQKIHYRSSLRAGWKLISGLRDPQLQAGATECCTCKMQMEQGAAKPTIHPIKLLALAYGLMPEVAKLLNASPKELTVT